MGWIESRSPRQRLCLRPGRALDHFAGRKTPRNGGWSRASAQSRMGRRRPQNPISGCTNGALSEFGEYSRCGPTAVIIFVLKDGCDGYTNEEIVRQLRYIAAESRRQFRPRNLRFTRPGGKSRVARYERNWRLRLWNHQWQFDPPLSRAIACRSPSTRRPHATGC